jgi:hypothetical protein
MDVDGASDHSDAIAPIHPLPACAHVLVWAFPPPPMSTGSIKALAMGPRRLLESPARAKLSKQIVPRDLAPDTPLHISLIPCLLRFRRDFYYPSFL